MNKLKKAVSTLTNIIIVLVFLFIMMFSCVAHSMHKEQVKKEIREAYWEMK